MSKATYLPSFLGGARVDPGDTINQNPFRNEDNVLHLKKLDDIAKDIRKYSNRMLEIEREVNAKYKEHADTQFKLNTALDNLKERLESDVPTHDIQITPRTVEPLTQPDVPDIQPPTNTPIQKIEE
jgi:hypothetical protein